MEDSTLRPDVYTLIYGIINSNLNSYSTIGSITPTLYGGFPDVKNIVYPCIIIEPIEIQEQNFTLDEERLVSSKDINVIIHIFSKANKDLDSISSGISNTIRTTSLKGSGMFYNGSTSDGNSFIQANEQKVKGKTLNFNFIRR